MKKNIYKFILFIAFGFILNGCENDITKSLYEEYQGGSLPQPVLNNIAPVNSALAGVDAIELTGENFSTVKENNLVYFGSAKASVLEASATRLLVRAPNNPAETLMVKVAVLGAAMYSEKQQYKLLPAAQEFAVKTGRKPFAITVDQNENIYASASENDQGIGVIKIAPDGTTTSFAPSGETFLAAIKLGPNGNMYALRPNLRAVFEIQPGVKSAPYFTALKTGQLSDLDFDKLHYMWIGGRNVGDSLYRVTLGTKAAKGFAFKGDVRALKIYNDYLYVAALRDGQEKIFRFPVNESGLGAEEEYYNFSTKYPERVVTAMLISAAGRIYLGNNAKNPEEAHGKVNGFPILVVNTDKTESVMFEPMLPDTKFAGPVVSMAWGSGDYFYYTRSKLDKTAPDGTKSTAHTQEIIKVTVRELGAPYYGRGDQ